MAEFARRVFITGAIAAGFLARPQRPKPGNGTYSNAYSNTY